uniref:Uncharacterized protein n=1 Tax=Rhizophora mucronata TaxID=61149 RepID=A0A2P2JWY3_RHIMU
MITKREVNCEIHLSSICSNKVEQERDCKSNVDHLFTPVSLFSLLLVRSSN